MTEPPDAERRPRQESGDQKVIAATDPSIARAADTLADFEAGYRLGWGTAYATGYAHGVRDEGDAWSTIVTGAAESWRRPRYAELEQRRTFDWQPCPAMCRACSRCIASRAYWARGGQPYAGVQGVAS